MHAYAHTCTRKHTHAYVHMYEHVTERDSAHLTTRRNINGLAPTVPNIGLAHKNMKGFFTSHLKANVVCLQVWGYVCVRLSCFKNAVRFKNADVLEPHSSSQKRQPVYSALGYVHASVANMSRVGQNRIYIRVYTV